MLAEVGLLTPAEAEQIATTLDAIGGEIEREEFAFSIQLEDIHTHIEQALIQRLGDLGRKLHTGRSRNDQIITDVKLWVRDAIGQLDSLLHTLQSALVDAADRHRDVILPGYTHMQRAQPVLAAHYFLAYVEKYQRDRERLADTGKRVNILPLGAAALAGTSLPIDRDSVRQKLGFAALAANSLDVSSDRDFLLEFVFDLTVIALHLGGWAEEWGDLVHDRVQFPRPARRVLHRVEHHAAQEKPRRPGADPGQDGSRGGCAAKPHGPCEGAAAGL